MNGECRPVAVRVFPRRAGQAGLARGWVRALLAAAGAVTADDAVLAAGSCSPTRSAIPALARRAAW